MDVSKKIDDFRYWFLTNKRDFPWREETTPYRVWISEIMLQQTLASVVIFYYNRWMERFPDIQSLAKADEGDVIKMWEGLGYYSRARRILTTARIICDRYQGVFPSSEEELMSLPGIGPYTVGAILSFAFHQKSPAVDGNVMRVIARLFCLSDDIGSPKTQKKIQEIVVDLLPENYPWEIMEALIELGATVCKKDPACFQCPLAASCQALLHGKSRELPFKSKKIDYKKIERDVFVFICRESVFIKKGKNRQIMEGLFEFFYRDRLEFEDEAEELFLKKITKREILKIVNLEKQKQTYTQFRVQLYPKLVFLENQFLDEEGEWVLLTEIEKYPFSSGHRKILRSVMDFFK